MLGTMRTALPLLILLGVLAAGCDARDAGPATTETRDVSAFSRVEAEDGVDVHVVVGGAPGLRVRAGRNVIEDVRTEVERGTLRVWQQGSGWSGDIDVDVRVPALDGLSASDGVDLDAEGIAGAALDIAARDGADVKASGEIERLALRVEDGADADLAWLRAADVRASLADGADASVFASRSLEAQVSDGADLEERGNPARRNVLTPR
jgi:Putative auto-transporter adhesin, head GIN domain